MIHMLSRPVHHLHRWAGEADRTTVMRRTLGGVGSPARGTQRVHLSQTELSQLGLAPLFILSRHVDIHERGASLSNDQGFPPMYRISIHFCGTAMTKTVMSNGEQIVRLTASPRRHIYRIGASPRYYYYPVPVYLYDYKKGPLQTTNFPATHLSTCAWRAEDEGKLYRRLIFVRPGLESEKLDGPISSSVEESRPPISLPSVHPQHYHYHHLYFSPIATAPLK